MKYITTVLLLSLSISIFPQAKRPFSIEGHRGARGYVPENTIPSFIKALELGSDTLELDVVVTKDKKVIVSHEPWFASTISLDKSGNPISPEKQRDYNIFAMNYAEVKFFDVGSIGNKDFPEQVKMKAVKPLLKDVFKEIKKYAAKSKIPNPRYNIEIKSNVQGDNIFHPIPSVFAKMVHDEIIAAKLGYNVIVQSFDVRPLQEFRKLDAKMPLALLVSNADGFDKNLENLGFVPDTYSPHFSLVNAELVAACRARGIKIIPWTINETADLERMKPFDLDGIITDYPDRAVKVFKN